MERTNFKNLSKQDLIGYTSKFAELRPEVASQVIAQFPELAQLIKDSLKEYSSMLNDVLKNDDASLEHVYTIYEKEQNALSESRVS